MGHWRNMIPVVVAIIVSSMALISHAEDTWGCEPDDYVSTHSCIRIALGLPPVRWDPELAKVAQAWADVRKVDCAMIHNTDCGYGENMASGPGLSGAYAAQMWLDERRDYDYDNNQCIKMCGHYTQMVWKNTQRIGCGRAKCDDNTCDKYVVVCNYDPPGNYVGERPY